LTGHERSNSKHIYKGAVQLILVSEFASITLLGLGAERVGQGNDVFGVSGYDAVRRSSQKTLGFSNAVCLTPDDRPCDSGKATPH